METIKELLIPLAGLDVLHIHPILAATLFVGLAMAIWLKKSGDNRPFNISKVLPIAFCLLFAGIFVVPQGAPATDNPSSRCPSGGMVVDHNDIEGFPIGIQATSRDCITNNRMRNGIIGIERLPEATPSKLPKP